jgi:hypothetical protein
MTADLLGCCSSSNQGLLLKLLTVSALTTSLGKLFHKLAERLKKKFSR